MSIICVLAGLHWDNHAINIWDSCFKHWIANFWVLVWFEKFRFDGIRNRLWEGERAQSRHESKKEANQTPEDDPHPQPPAKTDPKMATIEVV
jgi:hypothetical protein